MRSTAHVTAVLSLLLAVALATPGIAAAQTEPAPEPAFEAYLELEPIWDPTPGTRISSGPTGTVDSVTATFGFYSTEPSSTFECRLDYADWSACTSPRSYLGIGPGRHVFHVRSVDSAGQPDPTPSYQVWTVGTPGEEPPPEEPPAYDPFPGTRISSGPPATVEGSPEGSVASFSFYSTEPSSTFECRIDRTAWSVCDSPRTYIAVGPGRHTFYVRSVDSAGQPDPTPSSQAWTVVVPGEEPPPEEPPPVFDPTPGTRISSGPTGTVTATTASFGFYSTEPDSTFECRLDTGAWSVCSSPKSYSSLSRGTLHTFYVRSVDSAGQRDPTPSSQTWDIEDLPSPPGSVLLQDGFGVANGLNGVITNEYAGWHASDSTAPHSPIWRSDGGTLFSVLSTDASGNLDRVAHTGELDNGFADKYSQTNTHSNKMRFWTKRGGFGNVRVDVDIKPLAWGADAPSSWGGFKFYLRREQGVSDSPFYTVEPIIKDGSVYIQKKCLGDTGGGNYSAGGTYYLLADRGGLGTTLGSWQKISSSVRTNLDGSVTISMYRNGALLAQAVDRGVRSDGTGCAALSSGHIGFRSDYFEYYLDDFTVTALP